MRHRVAFFENYTPNEKYDVIIDIHGPNLKSDFSLRVYEQYLGLLKPGGVVLVNFPRLDPEEIKHLFGPKSRYAKECGYFLAVEHSKSPLALFKKIKL